MMNNVIKNSSMLVLLSVVYLFGGQDASKPPDKHVGAAMFKVVKTTHAGKHVYLEPLMVPTFEAARLDGDKILDTTVVKCDLYERYLATDTKDDTIVGITVLKCDGVEYGIEGVDFVMVDK